MQKFRDPGDKLPLNSKTHLLYKRHRLIFDFNDHQSDVVFYFSALLKLL
jgi:hypothetical protein